ncbi:MAG: V-type ATP synthase subunit A [Candidatus Hadarchaeales archaeon]
MGRIVRITGPVVVAEGMKGTGMYEVVRVGEMGLIGEVIGLRGEQAIVQVYEETAGLRPGEPVTATGRPLSAELGPGLVGSIYDGIQRPLPEIRKKGGDFVERGIYPFALPRDKKWKFVPTLKKGEEVKGGEILGTVKETELLEHRILVPPDVSGKITELNEGSFTVEEPLGEVKSGGEKVELRLMQVWPVRKPRPYRTKLNPSEPLITGQRVTDILFPVAKGGTAAIPGGFGTGKCVTPETPILLSNGAVKRIGDLFNELASRGTVMGDGGESFVMAGRGVKVISLGRHGLVKKGVHVAYRGTTDALVQIRTRSGRMAKLTPVHRLLVFFPDLTIREIPAAQLKPGMYLVAPRRLKIAGRTKFLSAYSCFKPSIRCCDIRAIEEMVKTIDQLRKKKSLAEIARSVGVSYDLLMGYYHRRNSPTLEFLQRLSKLRGKRIPVRMVKKKGGKPVKIPRSVDERLAEFLGLLLSDGMIKGNSVYFFNNNPFLLARFSKLCRELFGCEAKPGEERTAKSRYVCNGALVEFLRALGFPGRKKSRSCRIPPAVLMSPKRVVRAFLEGYLNGDGSFSGRTLEIWTASEDMAIDLSYILSRLGILYRVSKRAGYYRIDIEGKRELQKIFKLLSKSCVFHRKIKNYLTRCSRAYESVDVVPVSADLLRETLRRLGITRTYLESRGIFIKNYTDLGETPTADTFVKIVKAMRDAGLESESRFNAISELLKDVVFEKVKEVKILQTPSPVYDITVPETHNFVGGFGPLLLHNTVFLHQTAKWSDAHAIVYVGCGERGNEMCDVLVHFPQLKDPRTGRPLMERTVLIANTSNMPVAAREASVYTGVTIGEYFRDMGYHVALMADSTSRWAEAMREISGRLEEMPGEEGFPAYLGSRLAEFYERAGIVETLSGLRGSLTILGAVSPPGGDFSEPVTQNTLRIVKVFWGLDSALADRRHFPSVNWLTSYSLYLDTVEGWWNKFGDWSKLRKEAMAILQREAELLEIVRLVGPDALPEPDRGLLEVARMIREDFLQQSALDPVDTYCPPEKQIRMLELILEFHRLASEAIKSGVPVGKIKSLPVVERIARLKQRPLEEFEGEAEKLEKAMKESFRELVK